MSSQYFERELRQRIEYLPDRLYYCSLSSPPPASAQMQRHFFCIDQELVYWNFYLDFGPLNLGQLLKFCRMLNHKLGDPALKDKVIYFYSGTHAHKRANAAYLISSWALLCLKKSPEDAFKPFRSANTPFPPWVRATCPLFFPVVVVVVLLTHTHSHPALLLSPCVARRDAHHLQLQSDDHGHAARAVQGARVQLFRL